MRINTEISIEFRCQKCMSELRYDDTDYDEEVIHIYPCTCELDKLKAELTQAKLALSLINLRDDDNNESN